MWPMMDDLPSLYGQDEYFARIERQFGLRRGGPLVLSPRDWQRVERWQKEGIPLEVVLRGINRAFDLQAASPASNRINSLGYCEAQVRAEWEQAQELAAAAGDTPAISPTAIHLRECAAACRSHLGGAVNDDALNRAADALEALADEAGDLAAAELDRAATRIQTELESAAPRARDLRLPPFSPWAL
jgi:hypothetical protein